MTELKKTRRKRAGHKVICYECGENHYQTTGMYHPDTPAHPGMIKMIEPYLSWGWEQPPTDATAGPGVLECASCGAALAPSGRLNVEEVD